MGLLNPFHLIWLAGRTALSQCWKEHFDPVAAWPGGPGGAPTHLPLYDVGRHGHRRAPGVRSMYYQALAIALDQSSDVIVINLD